MTDPIERMKMIDSITDRPIRVSTDGGAVPYVVVPVTQLEKVRGLFDSSGVAYWVDEEAISLDGKPEVVYINLRRGGDEAAQRLLDRVP